MVVPCYVAPYEVLMGILITVAGIPVYYFGVIWKNKPKFIQDAIGNLTINLKNLNVHQLLYLFRFLSFPLFSLL